jgi:putative intracellular protease/amidase
MGRLVPLLFVSLFAGPLATLPWSGDDAITALRNRLRHRGYAAAVTAGPMVALWSDDAPSHPLTSHPAMPAPLSGAYLVYTDAGGWWMWPNGLDSGPQLAHQTIPE